jgi:HEPN domain-containing protein
MNPLTAEWVDKAEEDFIVAGREYRARKSPAPNAVCFHAQQCVEKYLKARLQEAGIAFPRTHHLPALLNLVLAVEPLWSLLLPGLQQLDQYSVAVRYPGFSANRQDAREAMRRCREAREEIRRSLGLPLS